MCVDYAQCKLQPVALLAMTRSTRHSTLLPRTKPSSCGVLRLQWLLLVYAPTPHRNARSCVSTASPCSHVMCSLGTTAVGHRHALSESYDPHLCHFGRLNTLLPVTSTCRLYGSSETPTAWMRVDTSRRGY